MACIGMCVHDNTTETVGMCRENVDKLMKTKRCRVSTRCTLYSVQSTEHVSAPRTSERKTKRSLNGWPDRRIALHMSHTT